MLISDFADVAAIAAALDDRQIHVWWLPWYRPDMARAPLRQVLAAYLDCAAEAVKLVSGEHGRPALDGAHGAALGFNWSHSGTHALIAVGRHVRPGIDVERFRERPRALALARRYFTSAESDALAALPVERRDAVFLALWTAKEAVLKAVGRGLAFGLDRVEVDVASSRPTLRHLDGDDAGAWQLQHIELDAALVATLAWRGGKRRIRLGRLATPA